VTEGVTVYELLC